MADPSLRHAVFQADDKLVLSGTSPLTASSGEVIAVRLTAGGALDTTFGAGGLVTVTDFTDADRAGQLMPGDYTGIGHDEFAVYLPDQGAYAYRVLGQADGIPFGTPGTGQSLPAPADYTGSGHVELGVYLPSLGVLAYRPAFGSDVYQAFGLPGPGQTIPVTRVILSPFPGSGGGSAHAMAIPVPDVVADGLAPLDLITRPDKKAKGGRSA